jgi:hypothetical protein
MRTIDHKTCAELLTELGQLDRRIDELRGARSAIVHDLEHAVRERDRVARHLAALVREEGAA